MAAVVEAGVYFFGNVGEWHFDFLIFRVLFSVALSNYPTILQLYGSDYSWMVVSATDCFSPFSFLLLNVNVRAYTK